MPVERVQRFIYRNLVERPRVNRFLDRFGRTLNRLGLPYATGLTRSKATLFTSLDPNMRISQPTVSETKEALRKMDRTRANLALGEYWRMEHGLPKASWKRVRLDRNILLAIAVSLGLHAGTSEVVCHTLEEELQATLNPEKPVKPDETISTEEAIKLAQKKLKAEAELKLSELRQQKKEFVQWLLQDLFKGRTIPISAFAVKAVVLDNNITRLENYLKTFSAETSEKPVLVDEQEMRSRYENSENKAREWTKNRATTEEKIDDQHYLAHFEMLKGYLAGADFSDLFTKGRYNCLGSTWLLASWEDGLIHSPDYGVVLFRDHIRSWFRDSAGTIWEIENTNGGAPRRTPFTIGVRAPVEGIIADYLVRNNVPVDQLPEELAKIFSQEFPDSGLSVPEGFVPNPYFGVRDPSSVAGTTQELYGKMKETGNIIEEARVYASIYSLLQVYGSQGEAGTIDLSLIDLSRTSKETACQIAERSLHGADPAFRWDFDSQTIYSGAILLADMLGNTKDHDISPCQKEDEWAKFEETAKRLINEKNKYYDRNDVADLERGVGSPDRAREWLKRMYAVNDKMVSETALTLLSRIASPEDFDFFKELLFTFDYNNGPRIRAISYFERMQGHDAIRAKDILLRAYQVERDFELRISIMISLAKLGYGMEVLTYIEEKLPSDVRELFNQHFIEDPSGEKYISSALSYKGTLIANIENLFPDRDPSPAELQKLIGLIHKEEDTFFRPELISLLALNGKIQEAREELSNYLLSSGYGNSDRDIAVFFGNHNGLLNYADLFIKEGFYAGPIIDALKSILNEPGNDGGMRTYAAIKLILAGELQ